MKAMSHIIATGVAALILSCTVNAASSTAQAKQQGGGISQEELEREQRAQRERNALLKIIAEVEHDSERKAAAIAEGADRSLLCSNCHGVDGNAVQPDTPNLASQQPAYLLEQLHLFAEGQRKNFVMQPLAAAFSTEDKVNLAIYYANQTLKPLDYDKTMAEQGRQIYDSVCFVCHGSKGMGGEGFAHIAGQRPDYVISALTRYRANARGESDPEERNRTSLRMEQVTHSLSDGDIKALANYVASLSK